MFIKTLEMRVSELEAIAAQVNAELETTLAQAYENAVADGNEVAAATLMRKIRNKLLAESDKEFTADRIVPEAPNGTTFSAWQPWLRSLAENSNNPWAAYRQALRDLPDQNGFPFEVEMPEKPIAGGNENG